MSPAETSPLVPYGPTQGMLNGLELLARLSPTKVDADLLRSRRVAPGNEYKVVGALRFLGLIDDEGHPTDRSQLLKSRGATYTLALQDIVRSAYAPLFGYLRNGELTRERIYNYFVTEAKVGAEMAAKATRFFLALCRVGDMGLGPLVQMETSRGRKKGSVAVQRRLRTGQQKATRRRPIAIASAPAFPMVFAITPEMAALDEEQLTKLFRKMKLAMDRAFAAEA